MSLRPLVLGIGAAFGLALFAASPARAVSLLFDDGSGLSATAEFLRIDANTLQIVLTNTSTAPNQATAADGLLTSIAFDLPGSVAITGGGVVIAAGSQSIGFDTGSYGAGTDLGGEWGYGNAGSTGFGSLVNYVSTIGAGATAFGGANLDGPAALSGPQGGVAAAGWSPGGLGGVQDQVVITLALSGAGISDLSFLKRGVVVEFGSDFRFQPNIPEPTAALAFAAGLVTVGSAVRRRR